MTLPTECRCRPRGVGRPGRCKECRIPDQVGRAVSASTTDRRQSVGSPFPGRSRQWQRLSWAFSGTRPNCWRDEQRHVRQSRAADENSAQDGELLAPSFGGHADVHEPERRMVAGDCGWHGIEEHDRRADDRHSDCREGDLSDRHGRAGGKGTDDEGADDARAAVKGGEARGHAREEWELMDCKREEQPAEEGDTENAQNDADNVPGGKLRDKGSKARLPPPSWRVVRCSRRRSVAAANFYAAALTGRCRWENRRSVSHLNGSALHMEVGQ